MTKKTMSFSLDPEVKEFADGLDNASLTVNDLLKSYKQSGGGREVAALQLRLDHKKKELDRVKDKEQGIREDINDIEQLISQVQADRPTLDEAKEALKGVPLKEDNPGIQNWANKLGMGTNELVRELDRSNNPQ